MGDTTSTSPDGAPDSPTDLSKRTWKDTLKRTVQEFKDDDLTLLAAAAPDLRRFSLALPRPARPARRSLGLAGTDTIDTLLKNLGSLTPTGDARRHHERRARPPERQLQRPASR